MGLCLAWKQQGRVPKEGPAAYFFSPKRKHLLVTEHTLVPSPVSQPLSQLQSRYFLKGTGF